MVRDKPIRGWSTIKKGILLRPLLLILGSLLITPLFSCTEIIELVCSDTVTGVSVNFTIDTDRNEIRADENWNASRVSIDSGTINFILSLEGSNWLHIINRSTGNLMLYDKDNRLVSTYQCENASPTF